MADTITYNFYEGSQKVDKIEHQTINYNLGGNKEKSSLVTPEELRKHIDVVLSFITNSRHWFSVCKMMMGLNIVGDGDFDSAVVLINAAYPEGLNVPLNPKDMARMNSGSWQSTDPEKWETSLTDDSNPISKGIPLYKTIALRFRASF